MSVNARALSQARRKRNSKKFMIAKMIEEISQHISIRGSRTELKYMRTSLDDILKQTHVEHENFMLLIEEGHTDYSDVWIDELSLRVNTCFNKISAYLEERENDTLSSASSDRARKKVERWREETMNRFEETETANQLDNVEISDEKSHGSLETAFSRLQINPPSQSVEIPAERRTLHPRRSNSMCDLKSLANLYNSYQPPQFLEDHTDTQNVNSASHPAREPVDTGSTMMSPSQRPNTYDDFDVQRTSHAHFYFQDPPQVSGNPTSSNKESVNKELYQSQTQRFEANNKQVTFQNVQPESVLDTIPVDTQTPTKTLTPMTPLETLAPVETSIPLHSTYILQERKQQEFKPTAIESRRQTFSDRAPLLQKINPNLVGSKLTAAHPPALDAWIDEQQLKPKEIEWRRQTLPDRAPLQKKINPNPVGSKVTTAHPPAVDAWIDELDQTTVNIVPEGHIHDVQMQMLIQQRLPPQRLSTFDGAADKWIPFISNFFDMVHKQPFLDIFQKRTYLNQHLVGEPKKAIDGFANDVGGYIASLKRLKYMFGNPSLVAQATIRKVVNGNQLPEYDPKSLTQFYYSLSTCINTLVKMRYTADIHSTDVLRQVLKRLPDYLLRKWSEYSFLLRKREEPTLIHLEQWLQARVMAAKDPYLPTDRGKRNGPKIQRTDVKETKWICPCCKSEHLLFRCEAFKLKSDLDKVNFVKSKQLCFNCLGSGHGTKTCPSKKHCYTKGCSKRHHTSLHEGMQQQNSVNQPNNGKTDQSKKRSQDQQRTSRRDGVQPPIPKSGVKMTRKDPQNVFLQVVPVTISNQTGDSVDTYALLDSGSQCTIITKTLCQTLNLPGRVKKVSFGTIKDEETMSAKIVNLKVSSRDGCFVSDVKNVYSLHEDNFKVAGQDVPLTPDPKWDYLRDLDLPQVDQSQVQVLIGADVPAALLTKEVRSGASGLPYATKTPLGWALFGVYEGETPESVQIKHLRTKVVTKDEQRLDELVKQFWETESFGTEFNVSEPMSVTDKKLMSILETETTFENGHYVVPMLWKSEESLPDSKPMASRRLWHLTRRFQRDQSYFEKYKENVDGYIKNDFAKRLDKEEALARSRKSWYLPHHGVINENKPGRVRMVFDAASKVNNKGLNSNLSTGPDLMNSLLGVLLRFRKHKIAVVADVEKMFYQVRLKAKDTDSLRFLWKDDPKSKNEPDHYKMLVHILGATCSPCCAIYALRRAINDQSEDFPKDVIETLLRNFYVDDLLTSVADEAKGKELISCSDKLTGNKGFNLTKYNSNSKEVLQAAPEHKRASNTSIEFENAITRALGVKWNLHEDCFLYNVNTEPQPATFTKRQILKKASTVFDPLGFLAPFTLKAKMILQELWRLKVGWDEPLDPKMKEIWLKWLTELSEISKVIRIPRSLDLIPNSSQLVQLHVFCDASEQAFAAVAYVRIEECGGVRCHIILAKTRVAPIRQITLPRLELQGAVMAVRVKETVMKEFDHDFERVTFWTDSKLNLQCINNEGRRFKTFVANRISEIREHSEVSQWNFVPGKINPSDLATREDGLEAVTNEAWFNGPSYLKLPETEWPTETLEPLDENYIELRKVHMTITPGAKQFFLPYERYPSWRKLVRIMARIRMVINNLKSAKIKKDSFDRHRELTVFEEEEGELGLAKLIQNEYLTEETNQLRKGEPLKGTFSKLDVFLDEQGIMRVGGRLKYGDFPYASKHQIVLPAKHPAVIYLGRLFHSRHHHAGKEHLLSLLRQRFWIIGGRVMCKQIIRTCVICQKLNARPSFSKMANLPEDRITISTPPFYHTGVDYFGPITVKILRSRAKRWGCIFTCLTTRAVHLEVAPTLESDDFINVLERFICRRGDPRLIRCDCGTNFKGASNELKKELTRMDAAKIDENLRRQGIQWEFNPPESPHMGGVWERMVRSVKTSLKATIIPEDTILNDFTLMTVLAEVEALVNSRPLTPVSDDVNDMEALTPNHFLIGRASTLLPTCMTYDEGATLRKRWKQVQSITQQFWNRWRKEYLPTLTARNKWTKSTKNVQVGDLVLVRDAQALVRDRWSLGRITQVFPGRDGRVRKTEVAMKSGRYVRPISMICPLELSD